MKAMVYHARGDVRVEDFPAPRHVARDEVRLRVKAAGICHTDFNEYMNGPLSVAISPHPRTGRSIPLVLGHEFSGEVVEVGADVKRVQVGDRVAVNAVDACRNCFYCRSGRYALCPSVAYIGFSRDGGFAEYAVVPEACCYRLGHNISFRAGALVEPMAVALHAVRQAGVQVGARAAVIGGGTVGLCVLQALRAAGACEVLVVEKSEAKKAFADSLGADAFMNPSRGDPVAEIQERTAGVGVDVAFECVGSAAALQTAVDVTRAGGTVCILGISPGPFAFDFNALVTREKKIVTSLAYTDDFSIVIAMLNDGRLRVDPLITRILSLDEAFDKGLRQYETAAATNVRMVIEMGA